MKRYVLKIDGSRSVVWARSSFDALEAALAAHPEARRVSVLLK